MPIPKCNPNVYREAAKLIDSGKNRFSCLAISDLFNKFEDSNKEWFYRDQYEAMFGPHKKFTLQIDENCGWSWLCGDESFLDNHPFWNRGKNEQTKEYRVMALLFMAAICENP